MDEGRVVHMTFTMAGILLCKVAGIGLGAGILSNRLEERGAKKLALGVRLAGHVVIGFTFMDLVQIGIPGLMELINV